MLRALSVLAVAAGCTTEEFPPEPFEVADTTVPRCAAPGETYPVMVSGTLVDYASGQPVANASIDVARAWDGVKFPAGACAFATLTSRDNGTFGPVIVNVPGSEPGLFDTRYLVFLVQGETLAPTASDNRIDCELIDGRCTLLDHVMPVPDLEQSRAWRQELRRGGMDHTWTRGLIAFEFRDRSAQPAVNVTPYRVQLFADRDGLEPGADVRYFDDARVSLMPPDTTATGGSGVALISPPYNPGASLEIAGTKGAFRWPGTGCLIGDGWIFVEDRQPSE